MGAYLSEPITEKDTEQGSGNELRFAVSGMQGWRSEMEDAHIAQTNLSIEKASFFGIFDGHGGTSMSIDAADLEDGLLHELQSSQPFQSNCNDVDVLKQQLWTSFIAFDDRKKPEYQAREDRSGCTATTCLVTATHIICANAGDSRSVMSRGGVAIPLSFDHKPSNESEKKRIEAAGGSVMMNRVNGDLAVSRALGDFGYKNNDDLPSQDQMISPAPDCIVKERTKEDDFIILACDGVWDVLSNDEAVEYVKENVKRQPDLGYLCEAMLDHCLNKNSRDNMTVCIVAFPGFYQMPEDEAAALRKQIDEERLTAKRKLEEEKAMRQGGQ